MGQHNELAAYEAVGRPVFDKSDILIAVWYGSPAWVPAETRAPINSGRALLI